jgi:hypothetical protein
VLLGTSTGGDAVTRKHPHAGLTGYKRDFVKLVHDLVREGGRNHREVFSDFVELAFCTFAKITRIGERADEMEARYMRTASARSHAYVARMPELMGMMTLALREQPCDFLGSIAGELDVLSEGMGQFFTPFELSLTMADLTFDEGAEQLIKERGFLTVGEPACGSGGMVLALAEVLARRGFDPCTSMFVQATDLSVTAFQMAYVQLSVRGLAADVIHGNTLTLEQFGGEITPGKLAFMVHHGERWKVYAARGSFKPMLEPNDRAIPPHPAPGDPAPRAPRRAEQTALAFDDSAWAQPAREGSGAR